MKIKKRINTLNYFVNIESRRVAIAQNLLKGRLVNGKLKKLTPEQQAAVDKKWGRFKGYYDPRWFELYNSIHEGIGNDICYCIPVDFWLTYIDTVYTEPVGEKYFDDKNMYDLYFPNVKQPRTCFRLIDGLLQDADYNIISKEKAVELCKEYGRVIAKPAVNSCCGFGIFFWDSKTDKVEDLDALFESDICWIVQEAVQQHEVLASFNESSCNTIRVLSFIDKGKVHVFPTSFIRFGGKGCLVDNIGAGGFSCGIEADGLVRNYGVNHNEERKTFDAPQRIIPNYHKILEIAEQQSARLAHITKLVAWDFTVDKDGDPVMIEVNVGRTSIQSFQSIFGPMLKDYVDDFLKAAAKNLFASKGIDKVAMKLMRRFL